jgi:hypothetical protein
MRNCRQLVIMTLFSTPVMCIGPPTRPVTTKLPSMFFSVRVANEPPLIVGADKSITLPLTFDTVPELPDCASDVGSATCSPSRSSTFTPVAPARSFPPPFCVLSCSSASISLFSSPGLNFSNGVGENALFAVELPTELSHAPPPGPSSLLFCAISTASPMLIALLFFLAVTFWSYSCKVLIASP